MNRSIDTWIDRQLDGWIDGWVHRWITRQMDRQKQATRVHEYVAEKQRYTASKADAWTK